MKYLSLLIIWIVLSTSVFAQPVDPSKYSTPIKVACIGNSITYGSGIPDRPRDSYPSQLARMLGEKWEVRNFGVGGRTLLKKGDFPFWKEEAYSQAKAFLPDVVIIKLGEENTYILANKYIRLGGPATIYPNTLGKQTLKGHHFPIDDLNAGANFIRNSYPEVNPKLEGSTFHTLRNKLHNAQMIFEREKKGRVAFLGGSITQGGGWRDSICAYLQKRFPETQFEFIAAGISSMGSTPGAFRFERDVLAKGKVDLLFEDAAVNDRANGFGPETQVLGMEGIVRHARESNPAIDIVMMHFVDPEKMTEYRKGITPPEILNHEKVAAHYGLSTINLAKEVTDRIDNGEFTWEKDFKNLHPSPFQWSSQLHLPWFHTLAYGLKSEKHRLEIKVSPEKNIQSKGTACRIRYFYVNK